jgi:hypothetical protein
MKLKLFFILLLAVGMLMGRNAYAQTLSAYKLPDMYRFDYEVEQSLSNKEKIADTSVMHFFYTKSGEYAAARISGKANRKGNLFVVLTRNGMSIIFDEHNKNITIINVRKLASGFIDLTKWIRMDSLVAHMRKRADGKGFQSVKTGKTKQISNYESEEYSVTDSRGHKGSVWCTKVDFLTQGDYFLSAVGGNWLKMMSDQQAARPLFQALTQPKILVTEIDMRDSTGGREIDLHTVSINTVTTTVSTTGYMVNDYSQMSLPEIFQAEMKKRNN